jgi:putative phosphoribosyl transferase
MTGERDVQERGATRDAQGLRAHEREIEVEAGGVPLQGTLALPEGAEGVVLFAHGSGSSRFSTRNRFVAAELRRSGLGTLLIDLLTSEEEATDLHTRALRFDIPMLAERVMGLVDWLGSHEETRDLRIGLFGASTGAGAALIAAAERPEHVQAVVSRGGRPDLAAAHLAAVCAPTLLIVGGDDPPVIELNGRAMASLRCETRLAIVAGATHLFEEPGALEEVARLAAEWFSGHLGGPHLAGSRLLAKAER